jgi:hypothetical protein
VLAVPAVALGRTVGIVLCDLLPVQLPVDKVNTQHM